jgi:hypothetical protein
MSKRFTVLLRLKPLVIMQMSCQPSDSHKTNSARVKWKSFKQNFKSYSFELYVSPTRKLDYI